MLDILGCPVRMIGNPYWVHFALVAFLLTWAVVTRRRENIQRRRGLGVLAAFGWLVAFAYIVLDRRVDDVRFLEVLLEAASFTTGCVLFELVMSPREPVPQAILVRDQEVRGGTRQHTDGDADQRARDASRSRAG